MTHTILLLLFFNKDIERTCVYIHTNVYAHICDVCIYTRTYIYKSPTLKYILLNIYIYIYDDIPTSVFDDEKLVYELAQK